MFSQKFSGAGPPTNPGPSLRGDIYVDTTANVSYTCMGAGPCTAVGAGNWQQIGFPAIVNTAVVTEQFGVPAGDAGFTYVPSALGSPSAPTIAPHGTTGATTWGYKITWFTSAGESTGSSETTISNGNAVIGGGSDYNIITPPTCPGVGSGIAGYRVYRTTAGGTPSSTGFLGTFGIGLCGIPLNDTGLTGNGTSVPTVDSTNGVQVANSLNVASGSGGGYLNVGTKPPSGAPTGSVAAAGKYYGDGSQLTNLPGVSVSVPAGSVLYSPGGTDISGTSILSQDGTNRRNVITRAGIEFDPVAVPTAPTATLISVAGNVDAGGHLYCLEYVTAQGKTGCGTESANVTTDAGHGQVNVTGLGASCPTGATSKNLYRTQADFGPGGFDKLLVNLACATSSYTDNTADIGLGVNVVNVNTTSGIIYAGSNPTGLFSNHNRFGSDWQSFDTDPTSASLGSIYDSVFYALAPNGPTTGPGQQFYSLSSSTVEVTSASSSGHGISGLFMEALATGTADIGDVVGLNYDAFALNTGAITNIYGAQGFANNSAGTATNLIGSTLTTESDGGTTSFTIVYEGLASVTGGASTDVSVFHGGASKSGGTLTNLYGLRLDDMTAGTNNWAIKTGLGLVELGGGLKLTSLPTSFVQPISNPAAPSVGNQGTPGLKTYTYCITAIRTDPPFNYGGQTACGASGTTTTGATTLDGTNFNRLTWSSVSGAVKYNIYRLASNGTPATLGFIDQTTLLTLDDTGQAGDGLPQPIYNQTSVVSSEPYLTIGNLINGADIDYQQNTVFSVANEADGQTTQSIYSELDVNRPFPGSSIFTSIYGAADVGFTGGADQVRGVLGEVFQNGSGTINTGAAVRAQMSNFGAGAITNAYLFHAVSAQGSGSITNLIGLLVEDQTIGMNNWAIKTGAGLVELGGTLALTGLPTSCAGKPTNSVAAVAGVLTLCP